MTKVSIIIPTYHSSSLVETLRGLQSQSAWHAIEEILVVGAQELGAWGEWPKVRYISVEDRPTPARNRNIGAREGESEWLCFTDADCVPQPNWVATFMAYAERWQVPALTGGVIIPLDVPYWALCDNLLAFSDYRATALSTPTFVPYGASLNFCIRRDIFFQLGGFSESFNTAAGEDWELSERLRADGNRILFVPEAAVEHRPRRDRFSDAWQHMRQYGIAVAQRKHIHGMDWRWRIARRLLHVPGLLEVYGVFRVLARFPGHMYQIARSYPRHLHTVLGVCLLDAALSFGMVQGLRMSPSPRSAMQTRSCR